MMHRGKSNFGYLFLLLISTGLILTPIFLIFGQEVDLEGFNEVSRASGDSISLNSLTGGKMSDNEISSRVKSIYSAGLKSTLETPDSTLESKDDRLKVFVLFNSEIEKEDRLSAITSLLSTCELIYSYEIIPAICMKVSRFDLIRHERELSLLGMIKSVSLSRTYEYPVITQSNIKENAINGSYYPNWWVEAINAEDLSYNGSGVRVAVIDSGMYNHSDLNIINNINFVYNESWTNFQDENGHGTHVGGIIGANGNLSSGLYRGIAPGASLINCRAGSTVGGLDSADIIAALDWCAWDDRVDIISMSFGGGLPYTHDILTLAMSEIVDKGIICVASSGNSGPNYFTGGTPATGIDVISVGATNKANRLANFSSRGPTFGHIGFPDVVAPGVDIISTNAIGSIIEAEKEYLGEYFSYTGNIDYIPLSGTSMSCPVATGALAILKEAYPNLTPETARIALLEGAKPLQEDGGFVSSGAGLIDVEASLNYLASVQASREDINDVAKIAPDALPVKPFDLINYPGDHQKLNLTILSGTDNDFDVLIAYQPAGISVSLDKSSVEFTDAGVDFVSIDLEIEQDALPGTYEFELRLSGNTEIYDVAKISLTVKLPEFKVLMESFHGLNDMFPEVSYNQLAFYDMIKQIRGRDIDVDYYMDYWTPDHNSTGDGYILTLERLSQYDLLVLQAPVLPFSNVELEAISTYYSEGGKILFLGTKQELMCSGNLNLLFKNLNLGIQIEEENVVVDQFAAIGTALYEQSIRNFSASALFSGVSKFYWDYGCSFSVKGAAKILANSSEAEPVVVQSGNFLAFGGLSWLYDSFTYSTYELPHQRLLNNIITYLLPEGDVSININLDSERTPDGTFKIAVYLKNQTNEMPLTINSSFSRALNVSITNGTNPSVKILMDYSENSSGIYTNDSVTLNIPKSPDTYLIRVRVNATEANYTEFTRLLHYNPGFIPSIKTLSASKSSVSKLEVASINATLDQANCDVEANLGVYSFSYNNKKATSNRTFDLVPYGTKYGKNFNISQKEPSGYTFFYIVPGKSGYVNPNSPRQYLRVKNGGPVIDYENSELGGYSFTELNNSLIELSAGTNLNFQVVASDSDSEETDEMRVGAVFFVSLVTSDSYLSPIYPDSLAFREFEYSYNFQAHLGTLQVPVSLNYTTINGTQEISTSTNYQDGGNLIGLVILSVMDNEGSYEDFYIFLDIEAEESSDDPPIDDGSMLSMFNIVVVVISIAVFATVIIGIAILMKREPEEEFSEERDQSLQDPRFYQAPSEYYVIEDQSDKPPQDITREVDELRVSSDYIDPQDTIRSIKNMADKLKEAGHLKQAKEKYKSALKMAKKLENSLYKDELLESLQKLIDKLDEELE